MDNKPFGSTSGSFTNSGFGNGIAKPALNGAPVAPAEVKPADAATLSAQPLAAQALSAAPLSSKAPATTAAIVPKAATPLTDVVSVRSLDATFMATLDSGVQDAVTQLASMGNEWAYRNGAGVVSVSYSFMNAAPVEYGGSGEAATFTAFSAAQKSAAKTALAAWADVANITFSEASGVNGSIRFGNTRSGPSVAWAYGPGTGIGGDVWVNPTYSYNQTLTAGSYGMHTMLHEIGHALGLNHAGEYNGDSAPDTPTGTYDTRKYSVMSYYNDDNFGGYYSALPLLNDIAALQALYGANQARKGNSTYSFGKTAKTVQAIWDAGGIDTIDASGQVGRVRIDLAAGAFSSIGLDGLGGLAVDNVAIAYGVTIENAKGGAGDDIIWGNSANNTITGGAGIDTLYGYDGADRLNGDAGNDTLYGGDGADRVSGDAGDDMVYGGAGADSLLGGAGNDVLYGEADNDSLVGEAGNDTLYGGDGDDRVSGDAGDDIVYGEAGNDSLLGGAGIDTLYGGQGNDRLNGDAGNDTLYGEEGDDSLNGGDGVDLVYGGDGIDILAGGAGNDTLTGELGNDTLSGDAGDDTLYGDDGDDTLTGGAGHDLLSGDAGADRLVGGDGNDRLFGDDDNDQLLGGGGNDTLSGDTGDDSLWGDAGNDSLLGGVGDDVVNGGTGNDTLYGNDGTDSLNGDDGADLLYGGDGGDVLNGGTGADRLSGEAGNDTLIGGDGADTLYGDDGDDTLTGGNGNDTLLGAAGDDTYVFARNWGADVIQDTEGTNQVNFGALSMTGVKYALSGSDLTITLSGGGSLKLVQYVGNESAYNLVNDSGSVTVSLSAAAIAKAQANPTGLLFSAAWIDQSGLGLDSSTISLIEPERTLPSGILAG